MNDEIVNDFDSRNNSINEEENLNIPFNQKLMKIIPQNMIMNFCVIN